VDQVLNVAFFVLHTAWIAFTSLGWVWRRARRLHLAAVLLTAASWFGLGVWYGWGYCPCTDWHWQVRARLGYVDPPSYTQLLIRLATGIDLDPMVADGLTVGVLAAAGTIGVVVNIRGTSRGAPGVKLDV